MILIPKRQDYWITKKPIGKVALNGSSPFVSTVIDGWGYYPDPFHSVVKNIVGSPTSTVNKLYDQVSNTSTSQSGLEISQNLADYALQRYPNFTIVIRFRFNNYTDNALHVFGGSTYSGAVPGWAVWFDNRTVTGSGKYVKLFHTGGDGTSLTFEAKTTNNYVTDNLYHTLVITKTSSTSANSFIDGVKSTITSSNPFTSKDIDNSNKPCIAGNSSLTAAGFNGCIDYFWLFSNSVTDDEANELTYNPHGLVRTLGSQFYFTFPSGIEANITLSSSLGSSNLANVIFNPSVLLAKNIGVSTNVQADLNESISLPITKGLSSSVLLDAITDLTLTSNIGYSNISIVTKETSVNLDSILGLTDSNIATLNDSLSLNTTISLTDIASMISDQTVSLGSIFDILASTANIFTDSITLNINKGLSGSVISTLNGSTTLNTSLGLSDLVESIYSVDITLSTSAGYSLTVELITPGAIEAFLTLAIQKGIINSVNIDYSPSITLDITQDLSNYPEANMNTAISLAVSEAISTQASKDIIESITLGLISGSNFTGDITIEGTLSLGINNDFTTSSIGILEATSAFSIEYLLEISEQAVLNAGLELSSTISILNDGVNPAVLIKVNGRREILLTVRDKNFLLSKKDRNILLT